MRGKTGAYTRFPHSGMDIRGFRADNYPMALTPSSMIPLGTTAPDFSLPEVRSGQAVSLADVAGDRGTLIIFLCAHCPYVIHVREEIARIGRDYAGTGIGIAAISSNDIENYPDDSPENLAAMARALDLVFPLLYDASQSVAKAYSAACTPDFFLFDAGLKLAYRGQLDDSRPGKGVPDGRDLRAAMDALLRGESPSADQKPSIGCNIKWRPA